MLKKLIHLYNVSKLDSNYRSRFYQTMPDVLKPFAPSFEGTMKVETAEDEEGYIMLRGQPPNYHPGGNNAKTKETRRSYKRQHSSLEYREPDL